MKKIIAFIGSPLNEQSNTAAFTKKILEDTVEFLDHKVSYEIITSGDVRINACKGCYTCFKECVCPLDKVDDMALVKQKMLEGDFIIWGSLVYALQVTGHMKIFIDRISYWLHLLPLAGKPGMAISTTMGTGAKETLSYLAKIMNYTGLNVIGGYNAYTSYSGIFLNNEELANKTKKIAKQIGEYISGEKKVETTAYQEAIFKATKDMVVANKFFQEGKYAYWEQNGYLECDSFSELIKKRYAAQGKTEPL